MMIFGVFFHKNELFAIDLFQDFSREQTFAIWPNVKKFFQEKVSFLKLYTYAIYPLIDIQPLKLQSIKKF